MKIRKILSVALVAFLSVGFVACNPDDDISYIDIEFEDVALGESGMVNNIQYEEHGLTFSNTYTDTYGGYWTGFAISKMTDMQTIGYANQYSVYATSGAAGSTNFAVGYYGAYDDDRPSMAFNNGVKHKIVSAHFALTTYVYYAITEGNDGAGVATAFSLENKDLCTLVVTGYTEDNKVTGEVVVNLADYTGDESKLFDQWTKVDLSQLGAVNRVDFKMTSTDEGEWGINTPTYFAIDNIRFEK